MGMRGAEDFPGWVRFKSEWKKEMIVGALRRGTQYQSIGLETNQNYKLIRGA